VVIIRAPLISSYVDNVRLLTTFDTIHWVSNGVNYLHRGVSVDPADLLDSHGVAEMLGLSSHRSVSTYRLRYADFPTPVVDMGAGRCLLWLRADIEAWAAKH
jgi:predicted DNA-binding transcriptional regulator AlpA